MFIKATDGSGEFKDKHYIAGVKFEFAAFSEGRFPSPDALTDK